MRIISAVLIASLFATKSAFATDNGPLTAGRPAGVRNAQKEDLNPLIYFGAIAVGVGTALAVSNGNNSGASGAAGGGSTTITPSAAT